MRDQIDITEFFEIENKLEIKYGVIRTIERVSGKNNLLRLTVTFNEETGDRTVISNIGGIVSDEDILMKLQSHGFYFVTNVTPNNIMGGLISEAIMLTPRWNGEITLKQNVIGNKIM
jgi:tRNA-binding EMAP/Myf-like protein